MAEIKKIKEYINKSVEFIGDYEEIFNMFSISGDDFENKRMILETIVEHNRIILLRKKEELKRTIITDQIIASKTTQVPNKVENTKTFVPIKPTCIKENDSVQLYLNLLEEGISIDDIIDDILEREDKDEILVQLLLRKFSELKFYNDMLKEEEYKDEAQREKKKIIELIETIKFLSSAKEETVEETAPFVSNYKPIFLKTPQGNIDFYSDIKSISPEFYEDIKESFISIIRGKPINQKKFISMAALESRSGFCRVVFTFVKEYCFITQVFIKKQNSEEASYRTLQKRIKRIKSFSDALISEYDEESFKKEAGEIIEYLDNNLRRVL